MAQIDILITNAHLFTLEGEGVGYIKEGAVAIQGSKIVATGRSSDLLKKYQPLEHIDAEGFAVLPGLIDAHMHTTLALARGVAQDVNHWMQKGIGPFFPHISEEMALAGTRLNILEGLRTGTTTFGDYTGPFPGWAEAFASMGVRARLTPLFNALPNEMADWKLGDLYPFDLEKGKNFMDAAFRFARDWNNAEEGRITTMVGPQAPDMLPETILKETKSRAEREGVMIHMHVSTGEREAGQMKKRYGQRSIEFLDTQGYLDAQLLAVHLTDATEAEAEFAASKGVRMALCSGSIGIIDGLVPPALAFKRAGGMVALGSDQVCGNNCSNIFNEMKLTALFNKIRYANPTVMPAWEVLRMATIEGARAIGLGDEIGSLKPGKQADLIFINLRAFSMTPVLENPVRNIVPNLVYSANGSEVDTVMVAGKILMSGGKILNADVQKIQEGAQLQAEIMSASLMENSQSADLELSKAMKEHKL